jgi:hypothetical protein
MDAGWVGRVPIGDEDDLLTWSCGSDRFVHGDDRGLRSPVIGNMVGGDFQALGGDEEKDILMFPQYPDIRFIAGLDRIDLAFMLEVVAMAVKRRSCRIVQDSLIRDFNIEDGLQNSRGFPGWNGEGDVKGKDQTENVLRVMDFRKLHDRFFGPGVNKLLRFVMILPVLVAEFELRASFLL